MLSIEDLFASAGIVLHPEETRPGWTLAPTRHARLRAYLADHADKASPADFRLVAPYGEPSSDPVGDARTVETMHFPEAVRFGAVGASGFGAP